MALRFIKTNPSENMTILIETPVEREKQAEVAKKLLAYNSLCAEQAGFIEPPENPIAQKRLQMMAGEFCGNATLSLAAVLAEEKGVNEETEILLEVSGTDQLIRCKIKKEDTGYLGRVEMPLPQMVEQRRFQLDTEVYLFTVVQFAGISHVIVPAAIWGEKAKEKAEQAVKAWAESLPAVFGILLFEEESRRLFPLVCVQGETLVWERGCGSGTAAIGVYLSEREKKSLTICLQQPGGSMCAEVCYTQGEITSLCITGKVSIVARGTVYL